VPTNAVANLARAVESHFLVAGTSGGDLGGGSPAHSLRTVMAQAPRHRRQSTSSSAKPSVLFRVKTGYHRLPPWSLPWLSTPCCQRPSNSLGGS
jgi:hypothetical protein